MKHKYPTLLDYLKDMEGTTMGPVTYSVVYDCPANLFRVMASYESTRANIIELLVQVDDGQVAMQFSEVLNVSVGSDFRKLFALGLQSFYTECITGALETG